MSKVTLFDCVSDALAGRASRAAGALGLGALLCLTGLTGCDDGGGDGDASGEDNGAGAESSSSDNSETGDTSSDDSSDGEESIEESGGEEIPSEFEGEMNDNPSSGADFDEAVTAGSALYTKNSCATCHGKKGEGDEALMGPALARADDPIADDLFLFRVMKGGETMVAYESALSDSEVFDILSFIRSLE